MALSLLSNALHLITLQPDFSTKPTKMTKLPFADSQRQDHCGTRNVGFLLNAEGDHIACQQLAQRPTTETSDHKAATHVHV